MKLYVPPKQLREPWAFGGLLMHGYVGGFGGSMAGMLAACIFFLISLAGRPSRDDFSSILIFGFYGALIGLVLGAALGLIAAAVGGRRRFVMAWLFGSLFPAIQALAEPDYKLVVIVFIVSGFLMALLLNFGHRLRWIRSFHQDQDVLALEGSNVRLILRALLLVGLLIVFLDWLLAKL